MGFENIHHPHSRDVRYFVSIPWGLSMLVLGRECFIFESTGKTYNMRHFNPALGTAQNIPIVNDAIAYDCQFSHDTYILIVCNTLHIESIHHN